MKRKLKKIRSPKKLALLVASRLTRSELFSLSELLGFTDHGDKFLEVLDHELYRIERTYK